MSHKTQPNLKSISELDFNSYAEGCNNRISLSSLVTADMIQYWIKVQNNLITQRYLNVKGSAVIGTWNIDFGGFDVLAGSVGLNSIIPDYMHYTKTISLSAFSYTDTNCDIAGWIIDYLLNPNDLCTLNKVSGKEEATDDNLTTQYQGSETHSAGYSAGVYSWNEILKIDFGDIKTIRDIHTYLNTATSGTHSETGKTYIQTSENGTDWTTRISLTVGNSTNTTIYEHFDTEIQAKYIRCYIGITTSANNISCTNTTKIYDISAIEKE